MALDVHIDPAETGLVVIDMQNGFCHPQGARGRAFGADSMAAPQAIVPTCIELIRVCRAAGMAVWFTRQVHYGDDRLRKQRRIPSHLDRRGLKLELCTRGTWNSELVDEIAAEMRPEDELVLKHRASAFYNTTFESELRMKGIQILICAGTTSSFCVESTIRDAYARDYDIIVPSDCIADTDDEAQASVLKNVTRFFGTVTTLAELTENLGVRHATGV